VSDELAATLARMKQALDSRGELWRVVIDAQFNIGRRIFRGYFVCEDAEPTSSGQSRGRRGFAESNDRINPQWLACSQSAPFSDEEKR
jgi:hypothetical protein